MTRYKVAPPARSVEFLETARAAIPLVPDSEADCCGAIRRATGVADRETAREYLTFLRALGLVAESDRGYHRTREDLDRDSVAAAYRERVFLVAELLDAVAVRPRSAESAFEAVRDEIPNWERQRDPDWERHWLERVDRLLAWAVLFDCLAVENDRFAPAQ
ncbi:hypothetical protein NDI56_09280 [Haloarcula sp. S1CR25-12]|uniref:Uncharacterized protein n=1 Tax=Haloarcula saliterrae TaxID=2950534 RepID=A0ABU2FBD3_9EURY|nr:hypothetical protein [Haloarcula sp. S1CR25-12]MDS0259583.1 hypothetical protein [Haloarcula sp. S1CR25-12]